jgi:hypothetical protein
VSARRSRSGSARRSKAPIIARTPVRKALVSSSSLLVAVKDGLQALRGVDLTMIHDAVRKSFGDSLDLDAASEPGNEQKNRWDYLLGWSPTGAVIAFEPHTGNAADLVKKKLAAKEFLGAHLEKEVRIFKWIWVTKQDLHHADTERWARSLEQNGIQLVRRLVLEKHLAEP